MKRLVVLLSLAACGGRAEETSPPTAVIVPAEGSAPPSVIAKFVGIPDGGAALDAPPAPPLATGPIRVAFGTCAAMTARFESGAITATARPAWGPKLDAAPDDPGISGGLGGMPGQGFGARRVPDDDLPKLRWGEAVTKGGDLDKAIIRRYLKRNVQKLTYCYEKELPADPKIAGVVATVFVIDVEGNVSIATADGGSQGVAACMATVIKAITFPKPKDGIAVEVRQSFTLVPGQGMAAEPRVPAPVIRPAVRDWRNPLPPFEAAIAECLRPHPKSSGVLALDLAYDKLGVVTSVTVNGVDDAIGQCIANAVKPVKHGANTSERCPIAFGALAIADAPLTITVAADTKPQDVLDKVRAHVEAARKAAPPAAVIGPVVVRADAATPMSQVTPILAAIASAGAEPAFASLDGTAILGAAQFPRVPRAAGSAAPTTSTDTAAYVLVTADKVYAAGILGRSQLPLDGYAAALAKMTGKVATSVELAAEDGIRYETLVGVVEAYLGKGAGQVHLVARAKLGVDPRP